MVAQLRLSPPTTLTEHVWARGQSERGFIIFKKEIKHPATVKASITDKYRDFIVKLHN